MIKPILGIGLTESKNLITFKGGVPKPKFTGFYDPACVSHLPLPKEELAKIPPKKTLAKTIREKLSSKTPEIVNPDGSLTHFLPDGTAIEIGMGADAVGKVSEAAETVQAGILGVKEFAPGADAISGVLTDGSSAGIPGIKHMQEFADGLGSAPAVDIQGAHDIVHDGVLTHIMPSGDAINITDVVDPDGAGLVGKAIEKIGDILDATT